MPMRRRMLRRLRLEEEDEGGSWEEGVGWRRGLRLETWGVGLYHT